MRSHSSSASSRTAHDRKDEQNRANQTTQGVDTRQQDMPEQHCGLMIVSPRGIPMTSSHTMDELSRTTG